jgi:pSer/pThr/pTyr-binding forkhead associated (FHA) protein
MSMATVTFQVLEGVDKGRIFRDLPVPVTIGREEGNLLRLNDERVSRFHAKVQQDNGDIILTDLESTNGTRVNGNVVQIRRLRPGDRVGVGRSLLLFGSNEEIAARMATLTSQSQPALAEESGASLLSQQGPATVQAQSVEAPQLEQRELEFDLNVQGPATSTEGAFFVGQHALPPLPLKLSPAQAARLAEILDLLHRGLTNATENIQSNDEGIQVTLGFVDWQKVLAVQMLLARYVRAISEPDALKEP